MGNSNPYIVVQYDDEDTLKKLNNRSRGERICRLILESILEVSFSSSYPNFLSYSEKKDGKKTNLEIDLFNEELGLGIEYQGKQHYTFVKHFHKDLDGFSRSCKKDDFKRKKCHENGVYLVEIPYFVKEKELCDYIWNRLPCGIKEIVKKDRVDKLKEGKLVVKK